MNTTFIIEGGAGRVVSSIPSLEKYERLNPHDDFKILVDDYYTLFWSHPTLQKRVFRINQKGTFDLHIKNNKVITPEPYRNYRFYNQKINMAEAFDEEINKTQDHSDLNFLCLHISSHEKAVIKNYIDKLKKHTLKNNVVVFQPFGSQARLLDDMVFDPSNRSFNQKDYLKIAKDLSETSIVIFASESKFKHPKDTYTISFDELSPYHRSLMCLIYYSDYYIGCCSVGQHVARCLNKSGLIVMGGTSEINFSYPNHFNIYRKTDKKFTYSPWRLSEIDCEFANRENDCLMDFNENEIAEILSIIKTDLKLNTNKKNNLKY